jgi:hypothetical protein
MKERELKLIRQLEDHYGSVMNAPDDDPRLLLLNRELSADEMVYLYRVTDQYTHRSRYTQNMTELANLLKVTRSAVSQQLKVGGPIKSRFLVTRGEWPEHEVGTWVQGKKIRKRNKIINLGR